jgi:hypothetical protein
MVAGMMAFDVALGLARAWCAIYTCRLAADVASDRRLELESDLWEMRHDRAADHGWRGALTVMRRLVDGVNDDLAWRMEQAPLEEQLLVRRGVAVVAAIVFVVGLWTIPTLFVGGMRSVNACAGQVPTPGTAPELHLELVRCAGAFFLKPE